MSNEVVATLRRRAADAGMTALVCLSPENIAYAAGCVVPSQSLMRWRHAAFVITATGRTAMMCVDMEEATIRRVLPDAEIRVWPEFGGQAMTTLAELLDELGVSGERIGVELSYLSVADHAKLSAASPGVNLVAADGLLERARQRKTVGEVELLARLSRISDSAIRRAFAAAAVGRTEMDIAAELTLGVFEQGAEQFKLMIVATGDRSELPNVGPSQRTLKSGDVCRVEIFSVIDGYQAGVCRTAVVGEPPPHAERIYQNLVRCKHVVLDALRPGVPTKQVYQTFRATFDELGMPPIGFVGHGIGVNLHERPYLGPDDGQVLEPGMVLGIEPLVYRSGHGFGMQIKDMVAITEDGCRLLSDITDTDVLLRVGT